MVSSYYSCYSSIGYPIAYTIGYVIGYTVGYVACCSITYYTDLYIASLARLIRLYEGSLAATETPVGRPLVSRGLFAPTLWNLSSSSCSWEGARSKEKIGTT